MSLIHLSLAPGQIISQASQNFACSCRVQLMDVWLLVLGAEKVAILVRCNPLRMVPGKDRVHWEPFARRLTSLYHGRIRLGAACVHCLCVLASALGLCHVLDITSLHACARPHVLKAYTTAP